MRIVFSILVAMVVLLATQVQAQTVRIATEGAYPPFNVRNAAGELVGFDVDIANALCAEMMVDCEIVAQDWDGIIPGLVNNKYDAIVASMSITEERQKVIGFSEPYYRNYLTIVAPVGSDVSQANLKDKVVGAQRSTVSAQWIEDLLGRRARGNAKLYDTQTAANEDLKAGRVDALVTDYLVAQDWLAANSGFEQTGEKIDINDTIGIGVRKDDAVLKYSFSAAIKAIRANGVYQKINANYFSADIY